jgi:hypothetical protein
MKRKDRQILERAALRSRLENSDWDFPNEHLGVADKFLLRLSIHHTFNALIKSGVRNVGDYRFCYYLNEEMKDFGYVGKKLTMFP